MLVSTRFLNAGLGATAVMLFCIVAASCGRSENVGWSARGGADSVAAASGSDRPSPSSPSSEKALEPGTAEAIMAEYQILAESLAVLRARALQHPELAARWERLSADIDSAMIVRYPQVTEALDRAHAIERRMVASERSGQPMTEQERDTLTSEWRKIQDALGQPRSEVLRDTVFDRRLRSFQSALYRRMEEIDPARADAIQRMDSLGRRLWEVLDTMGFASTD